MILEFKVKNFRSIRDEQSFSMLAEDRIKELPDSVFEVAGFNVLPTAVIYGRNASGKSNLLRAFKGLLFMVIDSESFKVGDGIPQYEPYSLTKNKEELPIEMSLDFIGKDNLRYIYSIAYSKDEFIFEELKFYPKTQPATLFLREKNKNIKYGEYLTGRKKEIENLLYPNQLFLSKIGVIKNEILSTPYSFFASYFFVSDLHNSSWDHFLTRSYVKQLKESENSSLENNINKLLRLADTGISSLKVTETDQDFDNITKDMSEKEKNNFLERYKYQLKTGHKIFEDDKEVGEVFFRLEDESTGTKKLFAIGGLIIDALMTGQTLIIDELDKSLHPLLTRAIIEMFKKDSTNPNKAQLIFATHDVSLLDKSLFRRDQVWLSEKEYDGSSHFYSVSDISEVRSNSPYEKWYLTGRFGGTPVINDSEFFFDF